jgi:hypothetical protein
MDLKSLKTQVTYRIEPKADGGFVARATDPNVPSIEGVTREEVQQKIRARAFDTVLAAVPASLRDTLENQLKSGGLVGKSASSAIYRSSGTDKQVIESATREQIDEFAKEFSGLLEKNFPQLAESLAARGGKTRTSTDEETGVTIGTSTRSDSAHVVKGAQSIQSVPANTPITPEASSRWPWFVLALLTILALTYFFFFHR